MTPSSLTALPHGGTPQVAGRQGNLEVGDPLTGNDAPRIVGKNGITYHLQELAFFSWFSGIRLSAFMGGTRTMGLSSPMPVWSASPRHNERDGLCAFVFDRAQIKPENLEDLIEQQRSRPRIRHLLPNQHRILHLAIQVADRSGRMRHQDSVAPVVTPDFLHCVEILRDQDQHHHIFRC
jgi:hypothetical protein